MRTVYRFILVSALFAGALGCDSSDSEPDNDAAADGGGRDAHRDDAAIRQTPLDRDSSVRPTAEAGRRSSAMDAGKDAGRRDDGDGGADSDGGADPGGGGLRYAGGDGTSCEKAVVIWGADGELQGVRAEYAWLREYYPGYTLVSQALGMCGEHWADILSIRTASGATLDVYFDIEDFFGT
jgi:hypothetical protein